MMIADGWKEEVVELCKKIVSRRSYSGEENGVQHKQILINTEISLER